MRVPIAHVPRAADATLPTVSRDLADDPNVNMDARQRIQRVAAEMGYVANGTTCGLATKRSFSRGIVVRDTVDPLVPEAMRSMGTHALRLGYSLILSHSGKDPQRQLGAINTVIPVGSSAVAASVCPIHPCATYSSHCQRALVPRGSRLTAQPFAARAARTTWLRQGWPWIIAWSLGGSASPTSAASAPGKKPTNARVATSVPWLGELSLLHPELVAAGET